MEKLAAQGSHSVEQKEVGLGRERARTELTTLHPDRLTFQFGRILRYQAAVITFNELHT